MKPTIRNKLAAGFAGVLLLMVAVAAIGIYAIFELRASAQAATRVGERLNSLALEIQVHNLEAQRRVKSYLQELHSLGAEKARQTYLEEAQFEMNEIETLAAKAVAIAPDPEKRAKFERTVTAAAAYDQAVQRATGAAEKGASAADLKTASDAYDEAAEHLHETAEDGEVAGRDASQSSQDDIQRTSSRAIELAIGFSIAGFLLCLAASIVLSRAILIPVDHLKSVAENVSLGNLEMAVRRYSRDEIGDLADSFSRMVTAVRFFRMEAEMSQAEAAPPEGAKLQ